MVNVGMMPGSCRGQSFRISEGFNAEDACSFVLGKTAPDAVRLTGAECVIRARVADGALPADGLGLGDAGLAGFVSFIEGVVEQGAVQAAARCGGLPFPVRHKGSGSRWVSAMRFL